MSNTRHLFLILFAILYAPEVAAQDLPLQREYATAHVTSGRSNIVRNARSIDKNCETKRGFSYTVTRPPKHGAVSLHKENLVIRQDDVKWATGGSYREALQACLGKSPLALIVRYQSQADYTGFDDFEIEYIPADRKYRKLIEMKISIRK